MKKVMTINLNGNAFLFEEEGYALLEDYFNKVAQKERNDANKDKVLNDLEKVIADKCSAYLSITKTVILTDEVKKILQELGPIEGANANAALVSVTAPKKRYRLVHKNALICGVCSGFAEYFGVDVWIVRVIFIIFTLLSRGGLAIIYLLIFFVVPYSDEVGAEQDTKSDNLIDTLQEKYKKTSDKLQTSTKTISWLSTIWDDFASLISMGGFVALLVLILILSLLWRFIH